MARLPTPRCHGVVVERDLRAVMSDGAVLLADRYAPDPDGLPGHGRRTDRPPAIVLMRCPYGRRMLAAVGRVIAEQGYQAVIQSCRGTFGSGGDWDPVRNERSDGHDTLGWIAGQSWFGGTVMTFGPSYLGMVQWAICDEPPEFVRAMAPAVTAASFRESVIYPGDAFALESVIGWVHQLAHQERPLPAVLWTTLTASRALRPAFATLPLRDADRRAVGVPVAFYREWLTHEGADDPWWEAVDFRPDLVRAPPATMQGGWYDPFLLAQVRDFEALRKAGREARLVIGPWTHASVRGFGASLREALAWFDAHGGCPDPADAPRARPAGVRLFVMGANRWVQLDDWPPPAAPERWHLHPCGGLERAEPPASAPDRFRYDPADPTPGIGGPSLDLRNAGPKDQRRRESRADVLTYTSAPVQVPVTVAGPLSADLYLRSSLEHFDVFVRLCVVSAKGRSTNLSDGVLRVRPGSGPIGTDGVRHLRVDLWPTAVTFQPGERIRLQVSSGAHPLVARNAGSGEPLASARRLVVADQEVFHDDARPSAVVLPVSSI